MTADRSVTVRLRAEIAEYQRKMAMASATTAGFVKSLDSADSRMGNLVQTALALGPALVPIGGAAVPAIAGLTSQLGFAVAGAGAAVLAFNGVGDALGALNDYQLEPTAENLEKLREELRGLGPGAREFVVFLDEVTPKLQRLRREAQDELLPGVADGIDELLDSRLPELRSVVEGLSRGGGILAAMTGEELASDDWDEFFDFLQGEAQTTLVDFGRTVGNVFEALTNTWMAMDPASDDFTAGLLEWSRGLAESTENLDESQGFQDFLSYVRENGPEAVDTLGALGNMLLELVEAAAPVGAASLPIIRAVADVLSAIADSPAGPVLIGAAAGLSAVSRSVALFNAANGSAILGLLRGTAATGPAAAKGAAAASGGIAGLVAQAEKIQRAAITGAAGLGVLGLSLTDVDDKAGLSNTAMLTLMGTMVAPGYGTAVGALAGLTMDYAEANDAAADSLQRVNEAIDNADYAGLQVSLKAANADLDDMADKASMFSKLGMMPSGLGVLSSIFGNRLGSEVTDLEAQADAAERAQAALEGLARGMGVNTSHLSASGEWVKNIEAIDDAVRRAAPALTAMGISVKDLEQMDSGELEILVARIRAWNREAESAPGRTRAIGEAIEGLDDDLMTTADSAAALDEALQALLSPGMNVSAATDAWTTALRHLNEDLAKNRTLVGKSDAAIQNREAIRNRVVDLQALLVAQAGAGASSRELRNSLRDQRRALIEAGEAAGMSKDEVRAYIKELGLTPKTVRTLIQADTSRAMSALTLLSERLDWITRPRSARISVAVSYSDAGYQTKGGLQERTNQADGGIIQRYANGGTHVQRIPQLRQGGGAIMWNEPETGWEAYISGKPAMLERNRKVWADAGQRLGLLRDSGSVGSAPALVGHSSGSNRLDIGDLTLVGTLQSDFGPVHVEGIARAAARGEVAADRAHQRHTSPRPRSRRGRDA